MAFCPGEIENRLEASGVFDYDGAVFTTQWDTRGDKDFYAYLQYYRSDHRPLWGAFSAA